MSLDSIFSRYPDILQSYTACKLRVYDANPCYLIPKVLKSKTFELEDHGRYLTIGNAGTTPIVIPVTISTAKEYMQTLLEVIHRYGGAASVPTAYANTLKKMGYIARKRSWGSIDFVFENKVLLELPGSRFSKRRNALKKLVKNGYTLAPVTTSDADTALSIEDRWASAYKGGCGGHARKGYASELIRVMDTVAPSIELRGVKMLDSQGQAVGIALGTRVTSDTWTCGYRFADNRLDSASLFLLQGLTKLYPDTVYELDGGGGSPTANLFWTKKQMALRDDLLIEMFTVALP